MNTEIFRIEEIGEVVGGGTPSTKETSYWNGNIPWITPKDLTGYTNLYISHGESFITSQGLNKSGTRLLPENTLLFTSRAPIGYMALAKNKICTNQGFKSIICKKEKVSPLFLYYYFKQNLDYIKLYGNGSTFPELSATALKKIKISLPCLSIQQKIASILSSYDNLIENNNKRIKLLEKMAEDLYKEWFVRFRFPGHKNVEMKETKVGKIPSSFQLATMKEVIVDYIGGGWGQEDQSVDYPIDAFVIRGADFPKVTHYDISSCPQRYHKINNYTQRQLQDGDIVLEISGGTEEVPVGRVVLVTNDLINRYNEGRVMCASFCKLLRLDMENVTPFYFYFWMQFLYSTRIITQYQLQSTGIINFKFEYFLRKGFLVLPPMDIMKQFDKKVSLIYSKINKLATINEKLTQQRDRLLPRLMSGKLEIKLS